VSVIESTPAVRWETEEVRVADAALRVCRGGAGSPLLLLSHDIGDSGDRRIHDHLARHFTLFAPSHPGYDGSERPEWLRSVRDVAVIYQGLISAQSLEDVTVMGLGFGGWIAAEMATMSPRAFRRIVLVGAMGIKPARGEILDQALLSYIDYVRAGFSDPAWFERVFDAAPPTPRLEQWDLNREMTFRIAWKPYMYSPTLPHLLGCVRAPALVVWGRQDRVVPLECGEHYARALPGARLEVLEGAGHFVELEQPEALARLVLEFTQAPATTSGDGRRPAVGPKPPNPAGA
jgi:pimeloyl-ACP methyl ester carboxylesterase